MTHTPGPWIFGVYETTEPFRKIERHACVCDPITMMVIATTGSADDEQSQMDAELIAAAPDLLEACEALVTYHDRGDSRDNRLTDYLNAARAAIAKARGNG